MRKTGLDSDEPQPRQHQSDLSSSQPPQPSSPGFIGGTWSVTKAVLVALSTAFCAIVLGISITLIVDPAIQSYVVVWTAPQAVAALFWSAIDLAATYAGSTSRRPIHPGAHAAVHLLLWLGFGVGIGLTAYILSWALEVSGSDDRDAYPEYYEYYHGGDINNYFEYYSKSYIRLMEVLVAFLALLTIVHFLLFFSACRGVVQRRRISGKPVVIPLEQLGQPLSGRHEKDKGDQTVIV
ncbi:uncharacterized protein F4812DRAFT_404693 [Daldinia caldariorum]|uniref:uncharacterized protein n=1 Tax=Daldinia caldariorum TaxID=326644 RepID=UPI0020079B66|nr:uncharacterized protein F4812DRAFT_404693 [Daldinia caldariorum]KAI1467669.1 hypothetical protein F4812DRAFT_404693 [Daldinia caldariorum]